MKKYMKEHELYIEKKLQQEENLKDLYEFHKQQIKWMQHERLIHLLVTLFTITTLVVFIILFLNFSNIGIFIITAILMVLTIFYLIHYYFMENTVQRWYEISNRIYFKIK